MERQFKKAICGNLLKLRVDRGYSQRHVGKVLMMSQPAYKKIEDGNTQINAVKLRLLADFYQLPVELFYRQGMVLDTGMYVPKTLYDQVVEQLRHALAMQEIQAKRIAELEAKVVRKDAKIEELKGDRSAR